MALSQALHPGRGSSNPGAGLPLLQPIYEGDGGKDQGMFRSVSFFAP